MAKDNGPKCRLCRREGVKLYLKGERCNTDKCGLERHKYPPGMHGMKRTKLSEFGAQLREKQKVRRFYNIMEKPFRKLFEQSAQERGVTAENFFRKLELRLDNVVYRMGFARSRQEAKQFVRHNHILVNGKRLNIPSARLKVEDIVSVAEKSKNLSLLEEAKNLYDKRQGLEWFEVNHDQKSGKILANPAREDIGLPVDEIKIVGKYSK